MPQAARALICRNPEIPCPCTMGRMIVVLRLTLKVAQPSNHSLVSADWAYALPSARRTSAKTLRNMSGVRRRVLVLSREQCKLSKSVRLGLTS